ncbi:acyltransferase family protein [Seonamhaeicola marinus]|uniref:Acyltransferase family protein n=1 Tax=Seonamhaeicola marinus TaxID=1912246 RepID=A0A5D0H3Z0_9FLAO|nr:acyltransferase family protein [Seonamhaeicola marinus]TYA65991.1 acyltransferase family protein [Seonamhaeicola marinus]
MKPTNSSKTNRQYYIDWLRIILIFSVFLYHIGMYFNSWGWHVKSNETVTWLNKLMWFLHLWRMPLLFLVSGVGTYYALGHRTVKTYLKERFTRLLLPFVIGVFTLVPVQVYLEKIDSYSSLGHFYLSMFNGVYPEGNFSWHHLWFILYLFLISLLISPFLNYLRSNEFVAIKNRFIKVLSKPMGLNIILIFLVLSRAILGEYFPEETHALYDDWAYFVYYILFFLSGFMFFTDSTIIKALTQQRRLYLAETILATVFLFSISTWFRDEALKDFLYGLTGIIIGWSCSITAVGYSKRYLNSDNTWRSIFNEGIYPFYLLHQPVILLFGYLIKTVNMPVIIKMIVLVVLSFTAITLLYWYIIRPINFIRVAFGMKRKTKKRLEHIFTT